MKQKIKVLLPDLIILVGIWLVLRPEIFKYHECYGRLCRAESSFGFYNTDWDKIGLIVILIGMDILVRKYTVFRKEVKK